MIDKVDTQKSNKRENPKISSRANLMHGVGKFYRDLALHMLGGEPMWHGSSYGDIHNYELDAMIEVKGGGTDNPSLVFEHQLDQHSANLGFPFSYCWYALFQYANHSKMRIGRGVTTYHALEDALARRTVRMVLLDIRVLLALRDQRSYRIHKGEDRSIIHLSTTFLKLFEQDPQRVLASMTGDVPEFRVRQHSVSFALNARMYEFSTLTVLPAYQSARVAKLLSRLSV